jgi:hypothetical protein
MRFLFWTFLKCPFLDSSKKCFFTALKNPEMKKVGIAALKMVRKNNIGMLEILIILENDPLKLDIFERMEQMLATVPF